MQLHTRYILQRLLTPNPPKRAVAYLALSSEDLWPGKGWNFVYGEAMLMQRVGVWSLYRFGSLGVSKAGDKRVLRRTLKVATHETGHMFSMHHCIAYECNMNGSNHLVEMDNTPLPLGPVCLAKLQWSNGCNLRDRFRSLLKLSKRWGLVKESRFFAKSLKTLTQFSKK